MEEIVYKTELSKDHGETLKLSSQKTKARSRSAGLLAYQENKPNSSTSQFCVQGIEHRYLGRYLHWDSWEPIAYEKVEKNGKLFYQSEWFSDACIRNPGIAPDQKNQNFKVWPRNLQIRGFNKPFNWIPREWELLRACSSPSCSELRVIKEKVGCLK